MTALQKSIQDANKKAGLSRQKTFAKKSFLKQTDRQVIEMLVARIDEMVEAKKGMGISFPALCEARNIARKHLERK